MNMPLNRIHDEIQPDQNLFGRSIDDIVTNNFFSSFDANIRRGSDYYEIDVAVPGFRRKDLSVEIADGILLVSAWRKEKEPSGSEFSCSSFNRSFVLPSDVDESRAKARCRDGILKIRLARTRSARTITVSGENNHRNWWIVLKNRIRGWFSV